MADKQPATSTLRMFNVIITFDTYCIGYQEESAIVAVIDGIKAGEISATHFKALELKVSPVRPTCRDEAPLVADDVSDEDFAKLRGKTTQEVYDLLTKKHG